jgi:hypothetical protein
VKHGDKSAPPSCAQHIRAVSKQHRSANSTGRQKKKEGRLRRYLDQNLTDSIRMCCVMTGQAHNSL